MRTAHSRKGSAVREKAHLQKPQTTASFYGPTLAEVERAAILRTLNELDGNRTRAAEVLGISLRCLRDKIRQFKKLGISVRDPNRSPSP
jgi:DNA-binding NtrC family response regulator